MEFDEKMPSLDLSYSRNLANEIQVESEEKEANRTGKVKKEHRKKYDVFLSHASKDKIDYVDSLYDSLSKLGVEIWYDTDSLTWGDKIKEKILEGTAKSEFAIIVISENFFDREWTENELNNFLQRQNESGQKIILPILHNITLKRLKEHYPELGNIEAIFSTKTTVEEVTILFAKELIKRLRNL